MDSKRVARRIAELGGTPRDCALAEQVHRGVVALDTAVAAACSDLRAGVSTDEMLRRQRAKEAAKKRRQRAA